MQGVAVEVGAIARWILLPKGHRSAKRDSALEAQPITGVSTTRRRILIVDDDWLISLHLEQLLITAGYEVVGIATDAATAITLAERERPDLVLMDIRLQGPVDGVEAAREIIDRFAIQSLFISAHTDQGTVTRALTARPRGWLPKPFTEAELLEAVGAAWSTE